MRRSDHQLAPLSARPGFQLGFSRLAMPDPPDVGPDNRNFLLEVVWHRFLNIQVCDGVATFVPSGTDEIQASDDGPAVDYRLVIRPGCSEQNERHRRNALRAMWVALAKLQEVLQPPNFVEKSLVSQ